MSERVVKAAAADLKILLGLAPERLDALVDAITLFEPTSASGVRREDAEGIAGRALVDVSAVGAIIRLVTALRGGDVKLDDVDEFARLLGSDRATPDAVPISRLLQRLATAAPGMSARFEQLEEIAGAMPTFRDCRIASGLRLVDKPSRTLVPVALVKIVLDEGEDPAFQCTIHDLRHLVTRASSAITELAELDALAPKFSSSEGKES